jgi:16S rRNA (guanine527-N7)-methyltransferase
MVENNKPFKIDTNSIPFSPIELSQLKDFSKNYYDVLHGTLSGLNLTAIKDPDEFFNKQILDSILPIFNNNLFLENFCRIKNLMDVGTGGGFPLLPLAYFIKEIQNWNFIKSQFEDNNIFNVNNNDQKRIIGIDGIKKKIEALKIIKKTLALDEVEVYPLRLENIYFDKDIILTVKAVATCADILNRIKGDTEIWVYFYKGPLFESDELPSLIKDLSTQGKLKKWNLVEIQKFDDISWGSRRIVVFKKLEDEKKDKFISNQNSQMDKRNKALFSQLFK